jgi:dTDP-4-dehydrorhamnose reductase
MLLRNGLSGRFHLGGPLRLSRFDLGRRVAERYGLPSALVCPVLQSDSRIGATRPADVSLDSASTRARLGWEPDAVDTMLERCRPGPGGADA